MYVTKFFVFEKVKKLLFGILRICMNLNFQLLTLKFAWDTITWSSSNFWVYFGTILEPFDHVFSYWFLVSFWGYFHIKGYYQLTNTSSDLTPFFLGFKLKELAEIRQFEPKNSHSSDTKVAWNPYEVRPGHGH